MHTATPWCTMYDSKTIRGFDCTDVALMVTEHQPSRDNAAFIVEACNAHDALLARVAELGAALKAATERMEAVAERIPVENRANGVSQATHVRHMAGHLAQHAKIARAALAKAKG